MSPRAPAALAALTALAVHLAARWRQGAAPDASRLAELSCRTTSAFVGQLAGALAVAWLYVGVATNLAMLTWMGLWVAAWAARAAAARRCRHEADAADSVLQRAQNAWDAACLALAAAWAAALLLLAPAGDDLRCAALMLIACVCGMSAPAVSAAASLGCTMVVAAPMAWRVVHAAPAAVLPLAVVLAGGLVFTLVVAARQRHVQGALVAARRQALALECQLAQEQAAAQDMARATTRFYAAASHDLRQPLYALGLCAGSLQRRPLPQDSAELVRQIADSARLLETLFDELLDLNRLDAGAVRVHVRPLRMGEVYERLHLLFAPEAFERGLALRFRGAHQMVRTDAVLLERILRNLLANALACTDDGTVLLGCRRRGDEWRLEVWDSGIGIDAADLPHLFDEYFQVEAPRPRGRGMGLGLAIVRRLASLLGGHVSVRSQAGHGSVFTLHLPAAAAAAAVAPSPAALPSQGGDSPALTIDVPSRGT